MKIAAIYDIHGNLPALEAVISEIRRVAVDVIVVGGDVLPGPMPRETLAALNSFNVPMIFISGNGEREVLATRRQQPNTKLPKQAQEAIAWNAAQLTPDDERQIAAWPATQRR